jgi:DNA primase
MGILDEDVVRVREAADVLAIVGQHTQLKRVGRNYVGLCPFHAEKTGSFNINAELGLWRCYGCDKSGDIITFVREVEHLDFVGAVEWLAGRTGIQLRYTQSGEGEGRKERQRLVETMEKAVEWYHDRLLTSPDAGRARSYLRARGFDGDEVRKFRLGWAPDAWDALTRDLGLSEAMLKGTGLGYINSIGRRQDFFRARILFPIYDTGGDPVAFGGRKLDGAEGPKYLNIPETRLYKKSKVLYGLNWSKEDAVRADEVIICEGYTDVIGFAAVGLPRAVAPCGTSLTEDHVRLLQRFAKTLVLAFDPDAAGQAAAERVYEWERKLEVDVAVADLPAGEDPGDLSRSDPDRLRAAITGRKPFLGFRVGRALAAGRHDSPEARARTAEAALAVVAEHPDELVRDQYVMEIADRCRLDVERLRGVLRAGPRPRGASDAERAPKGRPVRTDSNADRMLRLAVDPKVGDEARDLLDDVLFTEDRHVRAWHALRDADGDLHTALAAADPDVADLLALLAVEDTIDDPRDIRRALLRDAVERALIDLRREADEVRDAEDLAQYRDAIVWLQTQREAMRDEHRPSREIEDQLLAWLSERSMETA